MAAVAALINTLAKGMGMVGMALSITSGSCGGHFARGCFLKFSTRPGHAAIASSATLSRALIYGMNPSPFGPEMWLHLSAAGLSSCEKSSLKPAPTS